MSKKSTIIKYRGRSIRLVGLKYYAYLDSNETAYATLAEAKDAVNEFFERQDHVKKFIGSMRNMPYQKTKEEFFTSIQSKGLSETTQRNYRTFFRQFEKFKMISQTKDIDCEMVEKYLAKFKEQSTRHTNYMSVRRFVGFCLERQYMIDRKILNLKVKSALPKHGKRATTEAELRQCLEWMEKRKTPLKLLWLVGMQTGFRTGEAMELQRDNLDISTGIIKTNKDNNEKQRGLALTPSLVERLKEHMATCESKYLVSFNGQKYTTQAMQSLVKRMKEDLKLPKDVSYYSLRKRTSKLAYALGGPAVESRMLGHSAEVAIENYVPPDENSPERLLALTSVIHDGKSDKGQIEVTKESVEELFLKTAQEDKEWAKKMIIKLMAS